MRELAAQPGMTFDELQQATGLAEAALARHLSALYVVGSITSNPQRATAAPRAPGATSPSRRRAFGSSIVRLGAAAAAPTPPRPAPRRDLTAPAPLLPDLQPRRRRRLPSAQRRAGQRLQQLGVDAAEAAIAHAQHVVARAARPPAPAPPARRCRCATRALRAHGLQRLARVPAQPAGMAERQVGLLQAPGQLRLHRAQLHGVAARLEHRQDALRADLPAQAVDGGADRGGVVGEVVVDGDAAGHAAHFHAPLDVAELAQRRRRRGRRHAHVLGRGDGGQRIELVVHAAHLPVHAAPTRWPCSSTSKSARLAFGAEVADGRAEAAHLAPAALVQHAGEAFLQPVDHHAAGGRHGAHQVVELPLDRRQVVEDVGVVELQVVQDRRARPVVDELAALVEEGGVVFVGLDHERRRAAAPCCPGAPRRRSSAARRRPGSRAAGRRARGSRPASRWWWSCRACRPPPARGGPAARARPATAGRWCSAGPGRGWLPSAG